MNMENATRHKNRPRFSKFGLPSVYLYNISNVEQFCLLFKNKNLNKFLKNSLENVIIQNGYRKLKIRGKR